MQIRTYAHPLNVALVSVRSSRSSLPASSALGNKEFLSAQSTKLQARDFPLLSSRAQEKHHLPISQVLHLRTNLIGDYLQRVCWPPPRYVQLRRGERKEHEASVFSLSLCLKRRLSLEFFFKKQILHQICNQIQIGTNARSRGSWRELFILKTAFPASWEVPACVWYDGSALPESPVRACLVLKCWLSTPLSPGCCCITLTFPESFRWVTYLLWRVNPQDIYWNGAYSLGALGSSLDFCQNRLALCVKEKTAFC